MKPVICLIIVLVLILTFVACASRNEKKTTEPKVKTNVAEPLTWDKLDTIPLADNSMTEAQLRQICTDYMRLMLTFAWTPSKQTTYYNGSTDKTFYAGTVYGGLPYTPATNGNLYTLMEYYDPENGTLDLSNGITTIQQISNQCSSSTFWAWSRVCNTFAYKGGTSGALVCNGYLRVGPYNYDDNLSGFSSTTSTNQICLDNGPKIMFESYAQTKPADGLIQNNGKGHARMIAAEPHVVRNADGTIDGAASTITYLDQIRNWSQATQRNGVPYEIEGGVDVVISFFDLYNSGYIPFTMAELNKIDPVEKSETVMSYNGDSITVEQLSTAKITSNYPVSDVTTIIKDAKGNQVYRKMMPAHLQGIKKEADVSLAVNSDDLLPYTNGKYTIEVSARISTGEKPVVYTGTLVG